MLAGCLGSALALGTCAPLFAALPAAEETVTGETAAVTLRRPDPSLFPTPPVLAANVAFWTKVYTACTSDQVLLHDDLHLEVIYTLVDFTELKDGGLSDAAVRRRKRDQLEEVRERYRRILHNLAAGRATRGEEDAEERIVHLFAGVPGGREKYASAAGRLRTQTCLQDRFAEGIESSGLYMPEIERIFRARGLPQELTRLPFVESLFQVRAHSSASAGGIWQFVPSTARSYLKMNLEVDERFDPLRATEAAASYLSESYAELGNWPLAVTAYNHGRNGMKRAVRTLGTRDLGVVVERYRSRLFGFASRNFYSELLAAIIAYENRDHFFPGVEPKPALAYQEFVAEHYLPVDELARSAGVEVGVLAAMNPAFNRQLWSGDLLLPQRYPLRVPAGTLTAFQAAYEGLPAGSKLASQAGYHYRVRPGDSLSLIAARHGTSVRALQSANRLRSAHTIRIGQTLLIPPRRGAAAVASTAAGTAASSEPLLHVVRRGETVSAIARRYSTSVAGILGHNGLRSADRIYPGQKLRIPAAGRATHVVSRGETLAAIARRYGTTVAALQAANRILGHLIHPSQVLVIP